MVTPRTLPRWADVETEDDFFACLGLLAADARNPASGWSSRDVPGYLHGWARWIDDTLAQGSHADLLGTPSRRALAGQLFHARTAAPPSAVGTATIPDAARVESAADLAGRLRSLGDDCRDDDAETRGLAERGGWPEGRWAHGTDLPAYLEAWHATSPTPGPGARFKAATRAEVAEALEGGRLYE